MVHLKLTKIYTSLRNSFSLEMHENRVLRAVKKHFNEMEKCTCHIYTP